jgi:cytochrome P450 family 150 subfamily A5
VSDLLETVDFFRDPDVAQDPYDYYEALRAHGPAVREPFHDVVMITGYEEAVAVYHDQAVWSSCTAVTGPFPGFPVPIEGDDITDLIEEHRNELPFFDQLPCLDPPVHTAHRALLMRLITPKRLKENEEFMWRLADEVLDEFFGNGACEFVSEYAAPFTMLVVADLLGVPEADRDRFRARLVRRRDRDSGVGSTEGHEMEHTPLQYLYDQFAAYIEDRRANPRDDVLTGLAQATFPDGSLPEVGDAMRIASNLFAAGGETTARLLSASFQYLGDRPDLQQELRDDGDKIRNFIEEMLRIESPIKGDFRLSRVPTTVGGVDLPAGTTVMVLNGAANRDPRVFDHPDEFQIDRANARQHIAFGHGIHVCAGAPLARAEAVVTLHRFLDRTRDIRVSDAHHGASGAHRYSYDPTYILRGIQELYLEFTPSS